jgi:predicted nucleic acid-binding protein
LILVDSSLWIDLFTDSTRFPGAGARIGEFAVCGPIVQEVLQGLDSTKPPSAGLRDAFLALPKLCDPLPIELFLEAARIFMDGRRRGYTIRSGVDCLIAAIAIHSDVEVWHRDRDFTTIARYTRLRAVGKYVT